MPNLRKHDIESAGAAFLENIEASFEKATQRRHIKIEWNGNAPVLPLTALRVVDRDGNLVPFVPNKIQAEILESLQIDPARPAMTMPRGLSAAILKERQTGISTLWAALFFLDTIGNPNRRTGIVAHREETVKELFQIYYRYHKNLLLDFPELADILELDYSNKYELTYKHLGSWIRVGWARQVDVFSGFTLHNLHWSEIAKYACNVEELIASVTGSMNTRFAIEVFESTAKGRGNYFHSLWEQAKRGDGGRKAIFLPWPKSGKNKLPLPEDGVLPVPPYLKSPGALEYEQSVIDKWGLEPEDVHWWRVTKARFGAMFEQEYPLTDVEAFIAGDDPYFPRDVLLSLANACVDKLPIRTERMQGGELRTYEYPTLGKHYTLGADTATGEANEEEDPDYSAFVIYNRTDKTIAAVYRGRPYVNDYADIVYRLAKLYNNALIVPERNSIGMVLVQLLREDYRYSNIYRTKARDVGGGGHQLVWGFHTSATSKRLLLDEFIRGILEGDIFPDDPEIVGEMSVFENVDGKLQAKSGHDDLVIATALSYYGAVEGPSLNGGKNAVLNYRKPIPKLDDTGPRRPIQIRY